ncbi:hypothetical protein GY21_20105 [Cryobacterium roopkundense]|uniref:DUF2510 domain-containing protein n=2 Tax=Cryobacterium roopkundense TaxID=1001240 RepID=A0A099J2H9_9MICO|nr:hypothetical protein GY21_20105 [Cryobacterium roopkundense]MBB5643710.1 hypothetical protein [Cryobacterium roopkundense]
MRWWDGAQWTDHQQAVATEPLPPPKIRASGCLVAFLVVLGITVVGIAAFIGVGASTGGAVSEQQDEGFKVVYHAGGSATGGSITMSTPNGIQQHDVSLPLKSTSGETGVHFTVGNGEFLSIMIQNQADTGTVTCEIVVDGATVAQNTTSAAYGIASCDYGIPY